MSDTLPPLPEPAFLSGGYSQAWSVETIATWPVLNSARYTVPLYSADQMRSYAAAALAAAVAETDEELERRTGEPHIDGWPLYSGLPPPQREPQAAVAEPLTVDALRVEFERSYKGKAGIGLTRLTGGEYLSPAIETAWVQFFSKYTSPPQREPLTDEQIDAWKRLYRRAINEANGLTNYVEDRPELRGAERRISAIEQEARAISAPASVPPHHDPLTDAADAARFRWLAEHTSATGLERWVHPFQFLREAVDERMRAPASAPKEQA